ncbi:MAG: hypothetical protein ACE5IH_10505, partial [Thermodesulfobacteriota bacterium]
MSLLFALCCVEQMIKSLYCIFKTTAFGGGSDWHGPHPTPPRGGPPLLGAVIQATPFGGGS